MKKLVQSRPRRLASDNSRSGNRSWWRCSETNRRDRNGRRGRALLIRNRGRSAAISPGATQDATPLSTLEGKLMHLSGGLTANASARKITFIAAFSSVADGADRRTSVRAGRDG